MECYYKPNRDISQSLLLFGVIGIAIIGIGIVIGIEINNYQNPRIVNQGEITKKKEDTYYQSNIVIIDDVPIDMGSWQTDYCIWIGNSKHIVSRNNYEKVEIGDTIILWSNHTIHFTS